MTQSYNDVKFNKKELLVNREVKTKPSKKLSLISKIECILIFGNSKEKKCKQYF